MTTVAALSAGLPMAASFVPMSQAELLEDVSRPLDAVDEDMDAQDPHYLDREEPLHSSGCGWDDCPHGPYWLIEDLLEHITNVHINTQESKKPMCRWSGCARNGKPQASRFALMAHLRSHTGEKPFICPRPECDSLHSRADALQKHMRTKHEEVLPPIRKTGRVTGTGAEDASMLDEHGVDSIQHPPAVVAPPTPILEAEDVDDPLIASMLLMNPHLPADEVRSLCLEERLAALTREREGLLAELTSVSNLKLAVEGCKDDDVMAVLRKEIGGDVESLLGGHMTTLVWKYSNRTSLPNLVRAAVDPLPQVADHDDDD